MSWWGTVDHPQRQVSKLMKGSVVRYTFTRTHACVHTQAHMHAHTHAHAHTHTQHRHTNTDTTHTHTAHSHLHTHTHTHTHIIAHYPPPHTKLGWDNKQLETYFCMTSTMYLLPVAVPSVCVCIYVRTYVCTYILPSLWS